MRRSKHQTLKLQIRLFSQRQLIKTYQRDFQSHILQSIRPKATISLACDTVRAFYFPVLSMNRSAQKALQSTAVGQVASKRKGSV